MIKNGCDEKAKQQQHSSCNTTFYAFIFIIIIIYFSIFVVLHFWKRDRDRLMDKSVCFFLLSLDGRNILIVCMMKMNMTSYALV